MRKADDLLRGRGQGQKRLGQTQLAHIPQHALAAGNARKKRVIAEAERDRAALRNAASHFSAQARAQRRRHAAQRQADGAGIGHRLHRQIV